MGLFVGDGRRVGVAEVVGVAVWLGVSVLDGSGVNVLVGVFNVVCDGLGWVEVEIIAVGDNCTAAGVQPATSATQIHNMMFLFAIFEKTLFPRISPES